MNYKRIDDESTTPGDEGIEERERESESEREREREREREPGDEGQGRVRAKRNGRAERPAPRFLAPAPEKGMIRRARDESHGAFEEP